MLKKFKFLLPLVLLVAGSCLYGQTHFVRLTSGENTLSIHNEDQGQIKVCHTLAGFGLEKIETPEGPFFRIRIKGAVKHGHPGKPELPVINRLIQIPGQAETAVKVSVSGEEVISLDAYEKGCRIYPEQPSRPKRPGPDTLDFFYDPGSYRTNLFDPDGRAVLKKLGSMRGVKLALLGLSPFRYDPAGNVLTVFTRIEVLLESRIGEPSGEGNKRKKHHSPVFDRLFADVLNYKPFGAGEYENKRPLGFVILADTVFRDALQPFVQWKTRKGYRVTQLYKGVDSAGTSAKELRETLSGLYHGKEGENPGFTYLLIAGDVEHIPASPSSGQITDLYYAEYDGEGDYLPEVYCGRFSAADTSDLKVQIRKTLEYEQYRFADPDFLNRAVMIAGIDPVYAPTYGNGQINYGNRYYFNGRHGITPATYLHPESGGMAGEIVRMISRGAGFVNYTGHGYPDRWGNPRIDKAAVDTMQNAGKYPLVIGNGCSSALYSRPECFGEAMVRAPEKGALGYIGCTNDSYWDEDYFWSVGVGPVSADPSFQETGKGAYDRLFHDHGEPPEEWYIAQGQVVHAGNLAVTTGNPRRARYYWEIYNLLGDPSLMPYFSAPPAMKVYHPGMVRQSADSVVLYAEPCSYGAISFDDRLFAAGFADQGGRIVLYPDTFPGTGRAGLVVTGQNLQPYFDTLGISGDSVPCISFAGYSFRDSGEYMNGSADPGEKAYIDLHLVNEGPGSLDSVQIVLSSPDPFVEIRDSMAFPDSLAGGQHFQTGTAFCLKVKDSIPDGHTSILKLDIASNGGDKQTLFFDLVLHAPVPGFDGITFFDRRYGNGNGKPDPGETLELWVLVKNSGSSMARQICGSLKAKHGPVEVESARDTLKDLDQGERKYLKFGLSVDSMAETGSMMGMLVELSTGRLVIRDSIESRTGWITEDFETGSFRLYPWENDTAAPWIISGLFTAGGLFSAGSGNINDFGTSGLIMDMHVMEDDTIIFHKKVSSEADYDFLRFYIDTVEMARWSGEKAWSESFFPVAEGHHVFEWRYTKDKSLSMGYDRAWIDNIVFPRYSFSENDPGVVQILSPSGEGIFSHDETVSIEIRNFGKQAINELVAGYLLDYQIMEVDTLRTGLDPDSSLVHCFSVPADLSVPGEYEIYVFIAHPEDRYHGNDSLRSVVRRLNTTGENRFPADTGICRVYPNPSRGLFHVEAKFTGTRDVICEIRDPNGRLIRKREYPGTEDGFRAAIDLSGEPPGHYLLLIRAGVRIYSQVLVHLP